MDKLNGNYTGIELEMIIDQLNKDLPTHIKVVEIQARMLRSKYEALITVGFTEWQALEIIKARGLEL